VEYVDSVITFSTSELSINRHWITSSISEGEGKSEEGGRDMEREKTGRQRD